MSSVAGPSKLRAQLHNSALPAANTNLITDITASAFYPNSDQGPYFLSIYASVSIVGNLILRRTRAGVTVSEQLAALTANQITNIPAIPVDQGETINLQFSATTGTINKLVVLEKVL